MKQELANYKVRPSVVKVKKATEVTIFPRGAHARFDDESIYNITLIPMESSRESFVCSAYDCIEVKGENGLLTFTYTFEKEQAYKVKIKKDNQDIVWLNMYAVEDDLYHRRPLKGDLHVHSYHSDGREEPAIVAANYRKNGFDFLAITDHGCWHPSKEAKDFYKEIPTDLHLFYGEEVHVHGGYIHAVNFGGSRSVNEYYYNNEEKCNQEVNELALTLNLNENVDHLDYARRKWIADEIRKTGGLAILVHPHWMNEAYNMQDIMCDALFENNVYDAFELLGGQSVFENNIQLSMYLDQKAKGRKIPIVGSSDSHGTEPAVYFTEEYSIVYATDESLQGITSSIKDLYSVAVEDKLEVKRVYGEHRMVKFGLFLIHEFYPEYEELCFEQGRLMKDYVCQDERSVELLKLLQGRTEQFYKEFFGK